jgi:hypothetical protein
MATRGEMARYWSERSGEKKEKAPPEAAPGPADGHLASRGQRDGPPREDRADGLPELVEAGREERVLRAGARLGKAVAALDARGREPDDADGPAASGAERAETALTRYFLLRPFAPAAPKVAMPNR